MKADETTEIALRAVLDRLAEVYVTRDATVLRELFAPDQDVVMFSPGPGGRFVGLPEIVAKAEGDWSRSESALLTYRWLSASASVGSRRRRLHREGGCAGDDPAGAHHVRPRAARGAVAHRPRSLLVRRAGRDGLGTRASRSDTR